MKKIVKELAEQANIGLKNGHLNFDEGLMMYSEKFAELIVRECAELANEETSLPYDSYSEKIKQHFGVKE